MLLSVYTCVKNGIFNDYHVVDMLRHHLQLADEIVVNEGFSTDRTYDRISTIDPKIRVFRTEWAKPRDSMSWYLPFKDAARRECRGKWCLYLDADEFVPEWEFAGIRDFVQSSPDDLAPFRLMNFYGNYRVYHGNPGKAGWPARKMILHRNRPDVEFWGDGANVRIHGNEFKVDLDPPRFTVHHFGPVRHPARLRQKWHVQGALYQKIRRWFNLPSLLFNLMPHEWLDPQFLSDLQIYDGPYVKAVIDNPDEFVRDGFQVYNHLLKVGQTGNKGPKHEVS